MAGGGWSGGLAPTLRLLMDLAGFPMNEARIDPEGFMQAMIASFGGDLGPLRRAIEVMAVA